MAFAKSSKSTIGIALVGGCEKVSVATPEEAIEISRFADEEFCIIKIFLEISGLFHQNIVFSSLSC